MNFSSLLKLRQYTRTLWILNVPVFCIPAVYGSLTDALPTDHTALGRELADDSLAGRFFFFNGSSSPFRALAS
jgi:hypothetical protein